MAQATYQYQVTANQIVARLEGGDERYLEKGVFLPSNVDKDHRDHLVKVDLVKKVKVEDSTSATETESGTTSGPGETSK